MPDDRNHRHSDVDFIHCRFNHRRKSGSSKRLTLRVFTEVSKTPFTIVLSLRAPIVGARSTKILSGVPSLSGDREERKAPAGGLA